MTGRDPCVNKHIIPTDEPRTACVACMIFVLIVHISASLAFISTYHTHLTASEHLPFFSLFPHINNLSTPAN